MRKIALFGGAFDPPHLGHIQLIKQLKKLAFIDEIWLLPCGNREDKQLMMTMEQRFCLLQDIYKEDHQVRISADEIKLSQQTGAMVNTYVLLNWFRQQYSNSTFYFVIGADNVAAMHTWPGGDKLVEEHKFIIFDRKGYHIDNTLLPACFHMVDADLLRISSTEIKTVISEEQLDRDAKKKRLSMWMPPLVIDYLASINIL